MAIREPEIDTASLVPSIGLATDAREQIAQLLNTLLSDMYVVMTKTRNFHWNVTGPQFEPLHALFEGQYVLLAESIDEVAERVRMVGGYALGTLTEFGEMTRLSERPGWYPSAHEMVAALLDDYEVTIHNLRRDIDRLSNDLGDEGSTDLLVGILRMFEKSAWMLRATLAGWA